MAYESRLKVLKFPLLTYPVHRLQRNISVTTCLAFLLPVMISLIRICHLYEGTQVSFSEALTEVKASSYIAQYPVLRTIQSTLHFTSLTDLFTQTPSQLLWEASSHMLQLMHCL